MSRQETTPDWPVWAPAFIAGLALTGNVSRAAASAGVERSTAYDLQGRDQTFAAAWEDALERAADLLEEEARRRAYEGVAKPVVHQGEVVTYWVDADGEPCSPRTKGSRRVPLVVRTYSDQLLVTLLKAVRPAKYRERHEITGANGGPMVHTSLDLTKLPDADLHALNAILERAAADPGGGEGGDGEAEPGGVHAAGVGDDQPGPAA